MAFAKRSLIDTNVWIQLLRRDSSTYQFVKHLSQRSQILVSTITIAELYAGELSDEEERLYWALRNSLHVAVTTEIAVRAGHYSRHFKSHSLDLPDCLIAATAKIAQADLVTYNIRHFPMSDIQVLRPD